MKITPDDIYSKKARGEKITALTAYDFPTARILDGAGVDVLVIGDSLGMVLLGDETTHQVTVSDVAYHTKAVAKAAQRALVVADMPYRSYLTPEEALSNARILVRDSGADAVKIEGGVAIEEQIRHLVRNGIPVVGHIGVLPQSVEGKKYRVFGKKRTGSRSIMKDAKLLESLGVLHSPGMSRDACGAVTAEVKCPTIGIGAGASTDGQILVVHDILGIQVP